jgi:hypothetical protein
MVRQMALHAFRPSIHSAPPAAASPVQMRKAERKRPLLSESIRAAKGCNGEQAAQRPLVHCVRQLSRLISPPSRCKLRQPRPWLAGAGNPLSFFCSLYRSLFLSLSLFPRATHSLLSRREYLASTILAVVVILPDLESRKKLRPKQGRAEALPRLLKSVIAPAAAICGGAGTDTGVGWWS